MEKKTENLYNALNKIHCCENKGITKNTILFTVLWFIVLIVVGCFISRGIKKKMDLVNEKYANAVRITNEEDFKKAIENSVGYAFIQGHLSSDGVSYNGISGKFLKIGVWHERYGEHIRTETFPVIGANGNKRFQMRTVKYHSWDNEGVFRDNCKTVRLMNVEFPFETFDYRNVWWYGTNVIETGEGTRDVIQTLPCEFDCVVFCCIADKKLHDAVIYHDKTIKEVYDALTCPNHLLAFWMTWSAVSIIMLIWFITIVIAPTEYARSQENEGNVKE